MGLVTCVIITSPFSIFSKALVLETAFSNFGSLQTHTSIEQNLIGKYDKDNTSTHTHTHYLPKHSYLKCLGCAVEAVVNIEHESG